MSWDRDSKNSRNGRGVRKENELWKSIRNSLMYVIDYSTILCVLYSMQYFKEVAGQ